MVLDYNERFRCACSDHFPDAASEILICGHLGGYMSDAVKRSLDDKICLPKWEGERVLHSLAQDFLGNHNAAAHNGFTISHNVSSISSRPMSILYRTLRGAVRQ